MPRRRLDVRVAVGIDRALDALLDEAARMLGRPRADTIRAALERGARELLLDAAREPRAESRRTPAE